jgi:hypothetical protein
MRFCHSNTLLGHLFFLYRFSCDIPRTPHRRAPEIPGAGGGSRTAPRNNTNNSLNSSIVGIGKFWVYGVNCESNNQKAIII